MVQILNKMVHVKYPILEIWYCHKHTTQLPPSRLKFDTKLRKVFPQFWLFALANQMQACKTQIFGYLWHLLLFSNAFFKTQMWQKAEQYIPSRFVSTALHKSLLQAKYGEYCM